MGMRKTAEVTMKNVHKFQRTDAQAEGIAARNASLRAFKTMWSQEDHATGPTDKRFCLAKKLVSQMMQNSKYRSNSSALPSLLWPIAMQPMYHFRSNMTLCI